MTDNNLQFPASGLGHSCPFQTIGPAGTDSKVEKTFHNSSPRIGLPIQLSVIPSKRKRRDAQQTALSPIRLSSSGGKHCIRAKQISMQYILIGRSSTFLYPHAFPICPKASQPGLLAAFRKRPGDQGMRSRRLPRDMFGPGSSAPGKGLPRLHRSGRQTGLRPGTDVASTG